MAATPELTPAELRRGVERLAPWFHRVDLGGGVVTKSASVTGEAEDHPLPTWKLVGKVLPASLAGKTVLDVGCNAGFYSFEAARRGASRVLGVDAQRHQVRQALFCRRALGLSGTEFRRLSVYDLSLETVGSFDVVLALGLLYHLKHLVLALERLLEVTGELLVVETAVLPPALVPDVPFPIAVGGRGLRHHPVGYVENRSDAKEAVHNWFLPSPQAARAMLTDAGFEDVRVEVVTSDRAVLSARKPRTPAVSVLSQTACRLESVAAATDLSPEADASLRVRVRNVGRVALPAGAARVAAHLMRGDEDLEWEWLSVPLPRTLEPGDSLCVTLNGLPPEEPGEYEAEVDLVLENLTWLEDLGSPLLRVPLRVLSRGAGLPWYRVLGLSEALEELGETVAPAALRPDGRLLSRRLLDALESLARRRGGAWLDVLACSLVGHLPGKETLADWTRRVETGGLRRLARGLLLAPAEGPTPRPPADGMLAGLRTRLGEAGSAREELSCESFPGEASLAWALMSRHRGRDEATFVRGAYRDVLGRACDPDAIEVACRRLLGRETTRAFLLRDLLWSEELRTGRRPRPGEVGG